MQARSWRGGSVDEAAGAEVCDDCEGDGAPCRTRLYKLWFGATAKLQNRVKWIESSAFFATAAATTHRPLILILEIVSFEKLRCANPS
jgi:hypothetical protein